MGLLVKEFWFWLAVVGVIYAAFLGWTSRFIAKDGRLQRRNNRERRSAIHFTVMVIVTAIAFAEFALRITHSPKLPSFLESILTEEAFYELFIYPAFFMTGYSAVLATVDLVAEMLRIGSYQLKSEGVFDLFEGDDDYDDDYDDGEEEEEDEDFSLFKMVESHHAIRRTAEDN